MFKRSTVLVLLIVALVFVSSFTEGMITSSKLPSSFDPGISIDQAFKTAKTPLLIEFYSDTCGTCQKVSPILHELSGNDFKTQLTFVMMDVENPQNYEIAQLFGVQELPAIYVFDFKRMKKQAISSNTFVSQESIKTALDKALLTNSQFPLRQPGQMPSPNQRIGNPIRGPFQQPPLESRKPG